MRSMMQCKQNRTNTITIIVVVIFSILLALGTWNPFDANGLENDAGGGLLQIYTVLFVGYLFFTCSKRSLYDVNNKNQNLIYFYITLFLVTFLLNINDVGFLDMLYFSKLFIAILLCILLPKLFISNEKYLYYSLVSYAISCALIAILFYTGQLSDFVSVRHGRAFIFGENPNNTSIKQVIGFIIILYYVVWNPMGVKKKRFLLLLLLLPMLGLIIANGSRGSFFILIVNLMILLVYNYKFNFVYKYAIMISTAIVIYASIFYIIKNNDEYLLFDRISNFVESGDDGGRALLNEYAFTIFCRSPIIGSGTVGFANQMLHLFNESRTVHNMYLYILATSGFVGSFFFTRFLYKLFRESYKVRKNNPLSIVLLISILMLSYKTGGVLTYLLMWFVFGVIISINHMSYEKK